MLVELKYQGIYDILLHRLETPKIADRVTAVRELRRLRNKQAIPYLLDLLKTEDVTLQSEVVLALSGLGAAESIPTMLGLLTDDELYGPRSDVYHAVTEAFQILGGLTEEIKKAFPGNYPAMFNLGGAPLSFPEAMGLMGNNQSSILFDTLSNLQNAANDSDQPDDPLGKIMRKTMEDVAWKFGVMFADARDAQQDRVKRLLELLASGGTALTRAAAALSLPWYGEEQALGPLSELSHDSDEMVKLAATWARNALQKFLSYRNHFGM